MELKQVEELFNKLISFEKLVKDSAQYIKNILSESETNFLSEEDLSSDKISFGQLRIKYNRTQLFINNEGRNPYFRLEFYLYENESESIKYIYELEYNSAGEFSDEYFLEY